MIIVPSFYVHAHVHMQPLTRVISLSEETYKTLKKGKGESFYDIVVRITNDKCFYSLLEFAGSWVGDDAIEVAEQIMQERERAEDGEQEY